MDAAATGVESCLDVSDAAARAYMGGTVISAAVAGVEVALM